MRTSAWIVALAMACLLSSRADTNCVSPPAGLVAWWPGDGNANDIQGTNNGVLENGATFATGIVGRAFTFDGVDDFVETTANDQFNFNGGQGDFTVECWINPAVIQHCSLMAKATTNPSAGWALGCLPDGTLFFSGVGMWGVVSPSGVIQAGLWQHVAVTKSGNSYELYENGIAVGAASNPGTLLNSTTALRIGTTYADAERFSGLIDEPSIYNRALSSNEIAAIYTAGSAGKCKSTCVSPPSGLVSWWPAENDFADFMGANQPSSTNALSFVPGKVGNGVTFGTNGFIDIPDSPSLSNQHFTFETWARPDGPGPNTDVGGSCIIEKFVNGNFGYGLFWRPSDSRFVLACGVWPDSNIVSSVSHSAGAFYHLAGTYDGITFSLYVNGMLEGSEVYPGSLVYSSSMTWTIGAGSMPWRNQGYPRTWNGVIDEPSIYNRALGSNEIAAIYAAGSAGKCKGSGSTPFPNLVVASAVPPAGVGIQSGQSVTLSYVVQNVGAISTSVAQWSDLVVISTNTILGDADDIPLGTNAGFFTHTGALNTNQTYTANLTVQLPDGISGDYYLIVKVNALGDVNEGLLAGDNVTVSTNTFHINLANYPDLQVENLAVSNPGNGSTATVSWDVANRGLATAPAGFYNQLLIRNQTTGVTFQNSEYLVTQPLSVGATTSYVATVTAIPPATYQVAVTADSHQQIYEWAPCGHDCAEQNTVVTNFQVLQFYVVTLQPSSTNAGSVSGGGSYQAGTSISVNAVAETNIMPFMFLNWTEGGLLQSTNNPYVFTLSSDRQLVANFVLPSFQISASNNPPGAGTLSGTGSFNYGATNVLTAAPSVGYRFGAWTENGVTIGTNPTLTTLVFSNRSFTANYTEANPYHNVAIFTQPSGVANITGSGIYSNGTSLTVSAPVFVSQDPNNYTFNQWLLNGITYTNTPAFSKTFSTLDPSNVNFAAQYTATSIRPLVLVATGNLGAPVPATSNYVVTLQFDRTMQTNMAPLLVFSNTAALVQASVPTGGLWLTSSRSNDTYQTPPITFIMGMDGTNLLYASLAVDLLGEQLALTNCLNVFVDATPPNISSITSAPTPFSATVTWVTDEPATSQAEYGITTAYGSNTTLDSTLNTFHSQILSGLFPGTTYHFHVLSRDAAGNLSRSPDLSFATTLAPDLQIAGIVILPQTNLVSGMSATVLWTNANTGLGATVGSWLDQLVVSNLTTSQRIFATNVYYDATSMGSIVSGDYRVRQAAVQLPDGLPGVGQLLFVVTADINNAIAEYNASGTAASNNTATATATSTLAPYPDLAITGIVIPASAVPGASVQISWSVTNQGSAAAIGPWTDSLYLSGDATIANSQTLNSLTYAAYLAPGQSLTQTQTVVLPSGITGNRFVVINTDSGNRIFELNKTNNIAISASAIQLLNPDLVVDSVLAPSSAKFGDSDPVVWTVRNAGTAPAIGGWMDMISLSTSAVSLTGSTTLLTVPAIGVNPLAVGASYTRTQTVTLPLGASFTLSNYFIAITTDSGNTLFELNESNNVGFSSAIPLFVPQLPDLVVTSVFPPTNGFAGQPITLVWSVTNQGPAAAVGPWTDNILLSANPSANNAQVFASITYSNLLSSGDFLTLTDSVSLPPSAFGLMYLAVHVNASNDVYEGTGAANNTTVAGWPTFIQTPDLVVSSIQAPLEALTDRSFYVAWTVTNQTAAPAIGSWVDRVYLSWDDQPGDDLLLGEFPYSGTILGNQSVTRIQAVSIPRSTVTNGYYQIVVITDYANTLNEGTNNANNTLVDATSIYVTRTPLPDLALQSVNAPATAFSGQNITVSWTVQNVGTASTDTALWNDQVFLSTSPSPGGAWGNKFQNVSYLATNEAYVGSATLQIPINDFGTYYIVVIADSDNNVTEDNKLNNVTNAVINVILTPPPDLQVTSVQAPANSFSGQSIPVSWTVGNLGPGPGLAQSSTWLDTVYLSRTNVLDATAVALYSQRHYGVLLTNQFYTVQNQSVTLPQNIFGDYYVIVMTDSANEVFEYGYENNNANYDPTPVHITLTPPPDLVAGVSVPTNGTAGQPVTISWYVLNQGAGDTVVTFWYDSVYVSASPTFDASATLVGNFYHSGLLAAGGRYTNRTTYTPSVCTSGPLYFFVKTDSYNNVQEYDPSYDAEANNLASAPAPTVIAPVGVPDLQVPQVVAPQVANAGQTMHLSWVVTNSGTADAPDVGWVDRVYLSSTSDFYSGSPMGILDVQYPSDLAAGASYTNAVDVALPNYLSGFYYVFVMVDANNVVAECAGENNNFGSDPDVAYINPVIVPPPLPPPDLQVTSIAAPGTAVSGQSVNVSWVVANFGPGAVTGGTWLDSVYLSPSPNSSVGAIYMGAFTSSGTLPAGTNYQASGAITLPYRFSGTYYVMVFTDSGNNINEGPNENNNVLISSTPLVVSQTPLPDLQVASVTAPAFGLENQSITVNWTVTNAGSGPTAVASWSDYIYLSRDQILDPTDLLLGYAPHNGILTNGQSYWQSLDVQLPPAISGPYYIFVVADARGTVLELTENDNYGYTAQPVQVNLQPLSDLTVTSVALPATGSPGQPATFTWTVANQGANAASGTWVDSVYLSTNQFWDISAPLVGKLQHSGPLQPGQSYSASLTATLPAITPGQYYAIVRADILNTVRESNENNNTGVSAQTMTADVMELTLGRPFQSQLISGQQDYYKVNVPSNATMSVTLDSGETDGFNELFTKFGTMPDLGNYDYLYSVPWEPNQSIVVPQTQSGYYYNLARGEYVPQPPASYSIEAELVPFSITSVSPTLIGDNGQVTITLYGAQFQSGASVNLVSGTNVLTASGVTALNSATAKAKFYFTNAPHAVYDAVLINPGGQVTKTIHVITIGNAMQLPISTAMSGNQTPRGGQTTDFRCAARNISNVDAPYLLVHITVDGATSWSLRRAANTFPNTCTACSPNALDSITDEFGDSSGGFVARDVEPGEELVFQITVNKVTLPTTVTFGSIANTVNDFASWLGGSVENLRESLLTNTLVLLTSPFSDTLGDPIGWKSAFAESYVTIGLLDESGVVPFVYGTTNSAQTSLAKSSPNVAQTCEQECEGIKQLCWVSTGAGAASCFGECYDSVEAGPAAYAVCVAVCEAGEFIKHKMCELIHDQCLLTCSNLNCLIAIADGLGDSGAGVCPQYPRDPNELRGPGGYGPAAFLKPNDPQMYTIYFENTTNATASARQVQVVNRLDNDLDPRTVRIQQISFGSYSVTAPDNSSFYQTRVQLGANFNNLLADISAGVDIQNNQVVWTLTAIDPNTGEQPQSSLLGLLPPDDTNHVGEGYVTYTVQPYAGTPTGTVITNKATIIFDNNEPIDTNPWWNTVDSVAPTSSIAALPSTTTNTSFTVSWSGTDDAGGSGVASYDIFVSDNGAAYQQWEAAVTLTSDTYSAQPGHTYAFYSVATDNVGNREAAHTIPDAVITIISPGPVIVGVSNQVVSVGNQLVITNVAYSSNGPVRFSLGAGAPAGATITTNGIFRWSPACAQGSTTNLIQIWAADSSVPPFSNSMTFSVVVGDCVEVSIGSTVVQAGQNGCVPVMLISSVGITNLGFGLVFETNRLANWTINSTNPAIGAAIVQASNVSQALFSLGANSGQLLQGSMYVGQICFDALNGQSAFVPFTITGVQAAKADGTMVGSISSQAGRVVVIGPEPLLEAWLGTNSTRMLTIYGRLGASYMIEGKTNLLSAAWQPGWRVPMTNLYQYFSTDQTAPQIYYRAWEFYADPPMLALNPPSATNLTLLLYGLNGTNYVIETTSNLGATNGWYPASNFMLTNSFQFIGIGNPTNNALFFRAKRP